MTEEHFLTQKEVADWFRVDVKTIARWAKIGLLPFILTPSGRKRFPESKVRELRGQ